MKKQSNAHKDKPLREDINLLGRLLGQMLREIEGQELYESVEKIRQSAVSRRLTKNKNVENKLLQYLTHLPMAKAFKVARAFSSYFSLINLAERVHRIRRRRSYLKDSLPQRGSLLAVFKHLAEKNISAQHVEATLKHIVIQPVFTAHPTEAVRRSLLLKEQRIASALIERFGGNSLVSDEETTTVARIIEEISIAWQTEEHPSEHPSVHDEAEQALFYLTDILYEVVPVFYESMNQSFAEVYAKKITKEMLPLLSFGSWVGADMDGNPNVTADTIQQTLAYQREMIFKCYHTELLELGLALSHSVPYASFDASIEARINYYRDTFPNIYNNIPQRHRTMLYRVLLNFVAHRLEKTQQDVPGKFNSSLELCNDLEIIQKSLDQHKGRHAGEFRVTRLIHRIHTFGFQLAALDVRQNSDVHRRVAHELLGDHTSDETKNLIDVMKVIAENIKLYGQSIFGLYIISMTHGADDALAVLFIAKHAGLTDAQKQIPLDIAPLFETVPDLLEARSIMHALLTNTTYRQHLATRHNHQWVMLGYSDSSKISGIVASRWALQQAQRELLQLANEHGITLTIFHGRGGTVTRGGSKPREGILAEPPHVLDGGLRVTEQGEMINAKYGLHDIAIRSLELMMGAMLEHRLLAPYNKDFLESKEAKKYHARKWMEIFSDISQKSYRRLIYDDPRFETYFRQATPIDVIEQLHISSRPTSRKKSGGIANMRAIPWVFAWMQNRHTLTGWFGVGSGLQHIIQDGGLADLKKLFKQWAFFRNLIEDTEIILAIADMEIASHYAALADPSLFDIFETIRTEYKLTCDLICKIRETSKILQSEPTLARSIKLRNPYVDPMSFLQIDLLKRWRAGNRKDTKLLQTLLSTVKGIARGLQSTG